MTAVDKTEADKEEKAVKPRRFTGRTFRFRKEPGKSYLDYRCFIQKGEGEIGRASCRERV